MKWRKTAGALLAAALFLAARPALAAHSLTEDELAQAKVEANRLAAKKRADFAFRSHTEADIKGGAPTDENRGMEAEAYLLTPYCNVMSLQLAQGRSGRADFAALETAARTVQIRLRFSCRAFDRDAFTNAEITVRQGPLSELLPTARRYTPVRRVRDAAITGGATWHRVGVVLDFAAEDIQEELPVEIIVEGLYGRTLRFNGLACGGAFDRYETKSPVFAWTPLHDTL